jgi:hypothetical protein|eukprot:COSAG01_NODE_2327_length_7901_cov_9.554858_12_plen_36_part_00
MVLDAAIVLAVVFLCRLVYVLVRKGHPPPDRTHSS